MTNSSSPYSSYTHTLILLISSLLLIPNIIMAAQNLFFTFFLSSIILLIIGTEVVQSSSNLHQHHISHHRIAKRLLVFGDSYADTGNNRKSMSGSWKEPYGITFPGKPSGRFSDGRVFTDFLARSLGLKSPIAYRWRKYMKRQLKYGMNFAYGGTGVFDTMAPYPNMTTQIDFFQRLVNESVFTHSDLQNSVAHVSLAGNDYSNYLAKGGSILDLQSYIAQVVNQLVIDLQRIYNLGVKKISLTSLQPLGCLPTNTFETSFQLCNSTSNKAVKFHNLLLQQAVSKLNKHLHNPFVVVDLYTAFSSIIHEKGAQQGNIRFDNPLKPCCMGINKAYECGDVDEKGNKMYNVCKNPESYFFWDLVHPTQAGWHAVTIALQSTLQQLRH
ncbi:GDSL esterase/lipase At5g03610-like [Silene latifolia]|uniref:GDSL esterase/lipase At5g03610-like n=1 Tax=Silene latifolia TaxID=37657 RepID=UPI003D77AF6D